MADLRRNSLCGYSEMFADVLPPEFLAEIDPTTRNRHYGSIPVFWAWIAQALEGNASCSKAVAMIQTWSRSHGLPVPSSDTSSYCKGRERLPKGFLEQIITRVEAHLSRRVRSEDHWNGMMLKAIDGSSFKLADTPANQARHPQPSVQKPGCGFPVMTTAGLINLNHGGWEAWACASGNAHDITMAYGMLEHLNDGDLLLADRAYCSYDFIAAVRKRGSHTIMRLHQRRESALNWKKGRRISPYERIVTWRRPYYSAIKNGMTRSQWESLPEAMELRLIRLDYEDRTGRCRKMTVVTTLTDVNTYDGLELHSLYARRWEIELSLRDVKTTLGFEMINAKTPAMAHKTVMIIQIAYNLLRVLMQHAAHHAEKPTQAISFKKSLDLSISLQESFHRVANRPHKRSSLMNFLIEMMSERLVNIRPHRSEPRAIKQRPKPFPLLNQKRQDFVEIPHRSNYRASA